MWDKLRYDSGSLIILVTNTQPYYCSRYDSADSIAVAAPVLEVPLKYMEIYLHFILLGLYFGLPIQYTCIKNCLGKPKYRAA